MALKCNRFCLECNELFETYAWCKTTLFCSPKCNFFYFVVPSGLERCWEWKGRKDEKGYGGFGRSTRAHRFSYEHYKGPKIKGLVIRHLCNNPGCVNPHHLEQGTHKENSEDLTKSGNRTILRGEENGSHKLTNTQVAEIYNSKLNYKELARKYNVGNGTIQDVLHGRGWNHITDAPKFVAKRKYTKRIF